MNNPINIKDLIQYQKDSVVSREITRKETGTVTLFAFDKGQGLSEHTAPFEATVIIVDGKSEVTIEGKKHNLIEGEMIIMPAGSVHALHALEPFKMLLIMIKSKS